MTKIGIFIGTNNEFINTKYWEQKISEKTHYEEKIFELTRDRIYEKDLSSNCLVAHATLDNCKKIDKDFQEIDMGENFTYISFCHASPNTKLKSLHINNYNNVEVRFETIKNVDILDQATYEKNKESFEIY